MTLCLRGKKQPGRHFISFYTNVKSTRLRACFESIHTYPPHRFDKLSPITKEGQCSILKRVGFKAALVNGTVVLESLNRLVRMAGSTAPSLFSVERQVFVSDIFTQPVFAGTNHKWCLNLDPAGRATRWAVHLDSFAGDSVALNTPLGRRSSVAERGSHNP